jgi:hypothetical protein
VPSYRFYKVNSAHKIVGPASVLEFGDDAEARRHAKVFAVNRGVEICEGSRLVGLISHEGPWSLPYIIRRRCSINSRMGNFRTMKGTLGDRRRSCQVYRRRRLGLSIF